MIKIDKKSYKSIHIYYIGYITIKNIIDCERINSVNPLHFIAGKAVSDIKKNGNKYLVYDSTDKNKEVLEKYTELSSGVKSEIKAIENKSVESEKIPRKSNSIQMMVAFK